MKTATEVFNGFMQGLSSGTESWKQFVSDDIVFEGPIDRVEGIVGFEKLNANFFPMVRNHQIKRLIESDNTVVTEIDCTVEFPSTSTLDFSMAEFYNIENEKIQSIRVFYDAEEFRKELTN